MNFWNHTRKHAGSYPPLCSPPLPLPFQTILFLIPQSTRSDIFCVLSCARLLILRAILPRGSVSACVLLKSAQRLHKLCMAPTSIAARVLAFFHSPKLAHRVVVVLHSQKLWGRNQAHAAFQVAVDRLVWDRYYITARKLSIYYLVELNLLARLSTRWPPKGVTQVPGGSGVMILAVSRTFLGSTYGVQWRGFFPGTLFMGHLGL